MSILENREVSDRDAVMFDIDNTLIFTDGRPNGPVIDLLYRALDLGYKVVIITARPTLRVVMEYTKQQLHHYKIPYNLLFITPAENKGEVKKKTGLRYILSVGDQDTDLTNSMYALKIE
jgi:hydroxymethylpyrimidine pyrophosphatase-like HAD family hydrolase